MFSNLMSNKWSMIMGDKLNILWTMDARTLFLLLLNDW